MKKLTKIILTATVSLSLFAVAGCGSIDPKAIEGAYQNDQRTYYLFHSGTRELPNKDKLEEFKVYQTTPKSNYKGKQYYDAAPKIVIDKDKNICDVGIGGSKFILGKMEKTKMVINQERIGFSGALKKGEYKKTDEQLPTQEALKYDSISAGSDKFNDEHPGKVKTLAPKFHEFVQKKGWQ